MESIRLGKLPAVKIGGGSYLISLDAVRSLLAPGGRYL